MSEIVERFLAELGRVGGVGQAFESRKDAVGYLMNVLYEKKAQRITLAPSSLLEELAVAKQLEDAGFELLPVDDPSALKEVDVGITGVVAAVAESGTLLLGGPSKGAWQWASLLPPIHIAFVQAGQIRSSLDDGFRALKEARNQGLEEFVWITGPSRTADIAQTLFLGMHGPKELHVLIVP
jgi:L-lactate dehydrogenase complex protein LldG